jgi:hypothetical protein
MSASMATLMTWMKPLPRRHRIAHLRALLRLHGEGSARGHELAALLRAEITARPDREARTA